jgi:formiminoglutamase
MTPVTVIEGDGPVILGQPHVGTDVPDAVALQLNALGRTLADTDWHVDRLYDGLLPSATVVRATFHRYVIDANRDPSGVSLYPGQNTTGLVPASDVDGRPIWTPPPSSEQIEARRVGFHAPYHAALSAQIARAKARWGCAILYDCHSIRSRIPFLFDGVLPDFNIGDADGAACAPAVRAAVLAPCAASGRTHVVNGRFKGGWTTRWHGRPAEGVHAIQMELAQATHLATEETPFAYDPVRATTLRPVLADILARLDALGRGGDLTDRSAR